MTFPFQNIQGCQLQFVQVFFRFVGGLQQVENILLYLQIFITKNYILFKITAWGLFLKYSKDFTSFSLDILLRYILMKEQGASVAIQQLQQ